MPTPQESLSDLVDDFAAFDDWEDRYRYVIDLGRDLPGLTPEERTEQNRVRGCASQVWLVAERSGECVNFRADSDAHIVRGLIAILLALYSGRTADEILAFDAKAAFEELGLMGALSQQRTNGLFAMVERIRRIASDRRDAPVGSA
jgi:cysteine desulfuration protein SufE